APTQQDLCGRPSDALGDAGNRLIREQAAGSEGAVGLEHDVMTLAGLEQSAPVGEGVELNLVDDRGDAPRADDLVELADIEVGDSDRPSVAKLARPLHAGPRPGGTSLRPVDDVEVDAVHSEPPQAPFDLGRGVVSLREELRRDEGL